MFMTPSEVFPLTIGFLPAELAIVPVLLPQIDAISTIFLVVPSVIIAIFFVVVPFIVTVIVSLESHRNE
jgi:hypothetical protein